MSSVRVTVTNENGDTLEEIEIVEEGMSEKLLSNRIVNNLQAYFNFNLVRLPLIRRETRA